ncbi:MAG: hypothetical protein A2W36_00905 [Chloroflexi bacterium RBG_16_58_14]|nr:MAG: hypothetical protein A2W36_00905 [Chloroflexi bacterium RBG_16_58_14]
MKLYFACSITGGRQDESVYQAIVDSLLAAGHEVPTASLSRPEILIQEALITPQEVYARDTRWIEACDALIAEASTPSHGVGYEIGYALSLGKPVLCCYRQGLRVSKMISGNSNPNLETHAYQTTEEAVHLVQTFISELDEKG